jgi:hypothetical protein
MQRSIEPIAPTKEPNELIVLINRYKKNIVEDDGLIIIHQRPIFFVKPDGTWHRTETKHRKTMFAQLPKMNREYIKSS